MSEYDEQIKTILQQKFKSPVGIRENEETVYANIACDPRMLDWVRQIEILQIRDALDENIVYEHISD